MWKALKAVSVYSLNALSHAEEQELSDAGDEQKLSKVAKRMLEEMRVNAQKAASPPPTPATETPSPSKPVVKCDVMISYRVSETGRKDQGGDGSVFELGEALRARGYDVIVGEENICGGMSWGPFIRDAVRSCAAFVPVCSPGYGGSDWTEKELLYADRIKKTIIPVHHSGTYPPDYSGDITLSALQYVPDCPRGFKGGNVSIEKTTEQLVKALEEHNVKPSKAAASSSGSASTAKAPAEASPDSTAQNLVSKFTGLSVGSNAAAPPSPAGSEGDNCTEQRPSTLEAFNAYFKDFPDVEAVAKECERVGNLDAALDDVMWLTDVLRGLKGVREDKKLAPENRLKELRMWLKSEAAHKLRKSDVAAKR